MVGAYRYGFNGKEKDSEFSEGSYDFGARCLDVRVGRWLSVDPKAGKYPSFAPYIGMGNNPVVFIDNAGEDIEIRVTRIAGQPTLVQINFRAVIVNNSKVNVTEAQTQNLKTLVENSLLNIWGKAQIEGYKVQVSTDITVFNGTEAAFQEQTSNSTGRSIISMETQLPKGTLAQAAAFESKIEVRAGDFEPNSTKQQQTMGHEFGHLLFLLHPEQAGGGGLLPALFKKGILTQSYDYYDKTPSYGPPDAQGFQTQNGYEAVLRQTLNPFLPTIGDDNANLMYGTITPNNPPGTIITPQQMDFIVNTPNPPQKTIENCKSDGSCD